ncbi:hypothetical protein Efla_006271 [Eimeria flavescens]
MAMRQWTTAFWRLVVPLLLLLETNCLVANCSAIADFDVVRTSVVTEEGNKAPHRPSEPDLQEERLPATTSVGVEGHKDAPEIPTEEADIELLRSAMAAADVSETEKNTNAGHFLGVSRRMRRLVIVDFLGLLALLAGYHLIVSGLDHKGPPQSARRKSHKS